MDTSICPGCGVRGPHVFAVEPPRAGIHPACWTAFTAVLARVGANAALLESHQLTVSAFAVQHPGPRSPRSARAVAAHLLGLHLMLERGVDASDVPTAMRALLARPADAIGWSEPPRDAGRLTVSDLHATRDPSTHLRVARAWAGSVWDAWSEHHERVREWAASTVPERRTVAVA